MVKKGSVITAIFAFNTLIQLISQVVITRLFGASFELDVFLAAVALPTTLVTVIYGTLSDAFLPLYSRRRQTSGKDADAFFVSHLVRITAWSLAVTVILALFARPVSTLLYGVRGEVFVSQAALQLSVLLLSIPLSVFATLVGSYLYANKKFIKFPLVQLAGNAANLATIFVLYRVVGIWALVAGFILSVALQAAVLFPGKIAAPKKTRFSVAPFLFAWVPLVISSFASRSDTLLVRSLAADLPEGYLVYLNLSARMFGIAAGVATIGIQILLLPHLVEYIAGRDYTRAKQLAVKAKAVGIAVSAAAAALLWLIGPLLINLLFVGGRFSAQDAAAAKTLFPIFLFPAVGWGVQSIFFQPLMAVGRYTQLAAVNLGTMALGWGSALIIRQNFGIFQGLAFGLVIMVFSGIIGSEILWQIAKRRLSNLPSPSSSAP